MCECSLACLCTSTDLHVKWVIESLTVSAFSPSYPISSTSVSFYTMFEILLGNMVGS